MSTTCAQVVDTIRFAGGRPGTITHANGTLVLATNVTIAGLGAATMSVDGNAAITVPRVNAGVTAAMRGLTIQHGRTHLAACIADLVACGGGNSQHSPMRRPPGRSSVWRRDAPTPLHIILSLSGNLPHDAAVFSDPQLPILVATTVRGARRP